MKKLSHAKTLFFILLSLAVSACGKKSTPTPPPTTTTTITLGVYLMSNEDLINTDTPNPNLTLCDKGELTFVFDHNNVFGEDNSCDKAENMGTWSENTNTVTAMVNGAAYLKGKVTIIDSNDIEIDDTVHGLRYIMNREP